MVRIEPSSSNLKEYKPCNVVRHIGICEQGHEEIDPFIEGTDARENRSHFPKFMSSSTLSHAKLDATFRATAQCPSRRPIPEEANREGINLFWITNDSHVP